MTPLSFSIITVSRNSAATIARTIESVLNQTIMAHEYIVIDGASTDGTVDIIKSYANRFREKGIPFQWISEPDKGIYQAMNKGLARAQGEIIGIINSDDWYEHNTLALVDAHRQAHPNAGIIYGLLRSFCHDQPYGVWANLHHALGRSTLCHPSTFVAKQVYDTIGLFTERYTLTGDYEFFLRASKAGVQFSFLSAILANFSLGGASERGTLDLREKARIQFSYGIINRNTYCLRIARAYLKAVIYKLNAILRAA